MQKKSLNKKENIFWNWFLENEDKYSGFEKVKNPKIKEKLLEELLRKLHNYSDGLYFEIGGFPNGINELIVTAEGKRNYFKDVEKLVDSAPLIKNWNVIAFKPPMGDIFNSNFGGIMLEPKNIWFLPLENEECPSELGLRLSYSNLNILQKEQEQNAIFNLIECILGEKYLGENICHIEVGPFPQNPNDMGYIELEELRNFIEWRKDRISQN